MQGETTKAIIELFVALVAAAGVVGILARRVALPYTVALVIFGIVAAIVAPQLQFQVTGELVLAVLLPGLIFEAAFQLDLGELRRAFSGIALLAVPGVIVVALIVAATLAIGAGMTFEVGFVVGAMVAATDPAAVISTFKRLGSPRRLSTLIEGESLFNDGTGLVLFLIAVRAVVTDVSLIDAAGSFLLTIIGSTVIGAVVGWVGSRLVAVANDHLLELTISLATAYGAYLVADVVHESGIIATVVAGIAFGEAVRRRPVSEQTLEALDVVWEFIAFLMTALVFLLVGYAISVEGLVGALGYVAWAVLGVLISRVVVVYGLLGGTSVLISDRYHPGVPRAWLHVMFWGGLRGAVAVAMALSLPPSFPQRVLLQEIVFGVVLFTLLIQATTVEPLIRWTGAGRRGEPRVEEPTAAVEG